MTTALSLNLKQDLNKEAVQLTFEQHGFEMHRPTYMQIVFNKYSSTLSSGEGNGSPLQYSCLENPMDREAWQAAVHGSQRVGHN